MLRRKKSKADEVKDKATEIQEKAAETIGPKVSDARDAAESAFESVRDDIAPAIRDGVASAISTSDSDDTAKPKKKRGGKLKKLVIITGLSGAVLFVVKKVKDSQSGPPVPPPAPRPTPAPSPATPPRPTDGDGAASTDKP